MVSFRTISEVSFVITALLIWWLVVQILGLVGLPFTTYLFRKLPDQGYAFSKSLGLLLTGYVAWLLAMLGLGSFGAPLFALAAVLVGGGGLLLQHQEQRWEGLGREARAWLRENWQTVLAYEGLFLALLFLLAWLRSHDLGFIGPHPWGTERPMDLAFFNAIRHSPSFPPHDPWLSGYSINYYYFGYLLMAGVAALSGLAPTVAYNLALILTFALAALGIAGIGNNLISLSLRENEKVELSRPFQRLVFSFLGVLLVLFIGNQSGALQVLVGDHRLVALDTPQLISTLGQTLSGKQQIDLPYPAITPDHEFGKLTTIQRGDRVSDFNWWWPSRSLWDELPEGKMRIYDITEFPFFSFWLGDLHPHVMALPFNLLALALVLATLAQRERPKLAVGRRGWIDLFLTGIILGSLYVINSWDLPTYILLYGGALFLLQSHRPSPLTEEEVEEKEKKGAIWKQWGMQMAWVAGAILLLFAPFYLTFRSLVGFAEPLTKVPILSKLSQIIAPYLASKSGLHAFLIIFGLFFLPLLAFTYGQQNQQSQTRGFSKYLCWLSPLLLIIGLIFNFPLLALFGLMIFAFVQALQRADKPAEAFVLLLVALGSAICFGTEIIYVRDVFSNRMNTIFKFYYQVWLLWGTVTTYVLWWLIFFPHGQERGKGKRFLAYGVGFISLLLLFGGLVYPVINVKDAVTKGKWWGLEGQTPRENTPAGKASLRWLRQNVPAGSVVLETVGPGGGSYNVDGYGGVSASTGLPTVLGWSGHELQWRGGDEVAKGELEPRRVDVELIYSTPDPAQALQLLKKYKVAYVYVGALERRNASLESMAKFEQIALPVFQQEEVTIYKVK